jgi:putative tributyrin esterase
MRRLLDQMSAEVAVLDPPASEDQELSATPPVPAAASAPAPRRRRRPSRPAPPEETAAGAVGAPAPPEETAGGAVTALAPPAAPETDPGEAVPAEGSTQARRRWRRWLRPLLSGLAVMVLSAGLWRVLGAGLQGWLVGLGMDDERGALLGTLLVAGGSAAAVVAAGGGVRAARVGGVLSVLAIEVGPFLVRATHTAATEGLTAHVRVRGWILQPLGMLLLALLVVSVGAALGQLLRSDLVGLVRAARRRRGGWAGLGALLLFAAVAGGPALTAVQDGPISALYDYSTPATGTVHDAGGPALAAGGATVPGTQGNPAPHAAFADTLPGRQRPGHIEHLGVGGRPSLVYVPGDYAVERNRDFPVIYFLHGYPGNEDNWIGDGAQLPQVLDQVIGTGELPPVIAVMPDGNGRALSDAEWGNSERGDRVEDWLVGQAVPEVDRRYRTLGALYRGVAGLSSGGFGAVNLAMRHPDVFRWAASYSGYFDARRDIFGPLTPANSPRLTAPQLPPQARMPLFLGAGDSDRVYLAQQASFVQDLGHMDWQPVHQDLVAGGHGWEAWRLEMVHSLQWLGGLWGSDPGTPACRSTCNG